MLHWLRDYILLSALENAEGTERWQAKDHIKRKAEIEKRVPRNAEATKNHRATGSGDSFPVHRSLCLLENQANKEQLRLT